MDLPTSYPRSLCSLVLCSSLNFMGHLPILIQHIPHCTRQSCNKQIDDELKGGVFPEPVHREKFQSVCSLCAFDCDVGISRTGCLPHCALRITQLAARLKEKREYLTDRPNIRKLPAFWQFQCRTLRRLCLIFATPSSWSLDSNIHGTSQLVTVLVVLHGPPFANRIVYGSVVGWDHQRPHYQRRVQKFLARSRRVG